MNTNSRLFPELKYEVLCEVLKEGSCIDGANDISLEFARVLESLNIVDTTLRTYTLCVNQLDSDFIDLSPEQYSCDGEIDVQQDICPSCGRQIEDQTSKQQFSATYLQLNKKGISDYIAKAVEAASVVKSIKKLSRNSLLLELKNGSSLKVILLNELTEIGERYSGIYFGGSHLYVYYAVYERPSTNLLSDSAVIWLGDFLALPSSQIDEKILRAASSGTLFDREKLEDYERKFDDYIGVSWQDFEKSFVPNLMNRIIQNPSVLERYLGTLQALSNTILGSFPVSLGGAGKTDTRLISKYEYMSTVFNAQNIADAKRYGNSSLKAEEVIKVLNHLIQLPQNRKSSAIIFVSTNDIQSGAWSNICSYRDSHGYWMIVIIPKILIIELLVVFDALDLLSK